MTSAGFHPNDHSTIDFLSRSEIRAIDRDAVEHLGIPSLVLMENAARGVTDQFTSCGNDRDPVILCGPGNNGGDGLAVARQRATDGLTSRVIVVTADKSLSTDARINLEVLQRSGIAAEIVNGWESPQQPLSDLGFDDWIIDSLLGTGVQGAARTPFAEWINAINDSRANVLAVDLPSGLDCDTGTAAGACVRADVTVTFVAQKRGFQNPESAAWTGRVVVEQIGIPLFWIAKRVHHYRTTDLAD